MTRSSKGGLIHSSDYATLKRYNFNCEKAIKAFFCLTNIKIGILVSNFKSQNQT